MNLRSSNILFFLVCVGLVISSCSYKTSEVPQIEILKKIPVNDIDSLESVVRTINTNDFFCSKVLLTAYNRLCFHYYQKHKGQQALEYGLRAVAEGKCLERSKGKDSCGLDNAYYNLALAYFEINNNEAYVQCLRQSLQYGSKDDYELLGIISQGLAGYYVEKAKENDALTDSILLYTEDAYKYLRLANLDDQIPFARINHASYFIQKKQFDSATVVLNEVINSTTVEGNNLTLENVLLAKCYIFQHKFAQAESLLNKCLQSLSKTNNISDRIIVLSRFEELYLEQKNYAKLAEIRGALVDLTDKNYNQNISNHIKEIEASYIVKQKNADIQALDLKNKLAEKQLLFRNVLLLLLLLLSVVIVIAIYQHYNSKKIKEESNRIVLEQKLFVAQINPHFIFNALSAVQAEILSNNPKQASNYLASFGQLLQSILVGTTQEYIGIAQEYKNLQQYLTLQKIRFTTFEYTITAYEGIENDETQIAPMLIQPLVENAIEHGIKRSDKKGEIELRFHKTDHTFICEVLDNGNGLTSIDGKGKLSISTQLIRKRLEYLSNTFKSVAFLTIENRIDSKGVVSKIVMPIIKAFKDE